jgi:hypothetical protein
VYVLKPNKQLGEDGEQASRALVARCIQGSIDQKSGVHDKGADLVAQFSAFDGGALSCRLQIKTGESYVKQEEDGRWKVKNISAREFEIWKKSRDAFFLIWVRNADELYFAEIGSGTSLKQLSFSGKTRVFPSFLTELRARTDKANTGQKLRRSVEKIRPPLSMTLRNFAKHRFRSLIGSKCVHPTLGEIAVTWGTWRHFTRKRRNPKNIHDTLELIDLIPVLVPRAVRFSAIRRTKLLTIGDQSFESRLFIYQTPELAIGSSRSKYVVVIKETTSFPRDWSNKLDLERYVKRSLTLESVYPVK